MKCGDCWGGGRGSLGYCFMVSPAYFTDLFSIKSNWALSPPLVWLRNANLSKCQYFMCTFNDRSNFCVDSYSPCKSWLAFPLKWSSFIGSDKRSLSQIPIFTRKGRLNWPNIWSSGRLRQFEKNDDYLHNYFPLMAKLPVLLMPHFLTSQVFHKLPTPLSICGHPDWAKLR